MYQLIRDGIIDNMCMCAHILATLKVSLKNKKMKLKKGLMTISLRDKSRILIEKPMMILIMKGWFSLNTQYCKLRLIKTWWLERGKKVKLSLMKLMMIYFNKHLIMKNSLKFSFKNLKKTKISFKGLASKMMNNQMYLTWWIVQIK